MTRLDFDSASVDFREQVIVGSFGRRFGDVLSLRLGAGAITSGRIVDGGVRYDIEPGWLTSATIAHEWLGRAGHGWFVSTALTIGISATHTTNPEAGRTSLVAQDTRVSAVAGKTVGGVFSPYAAARVFGGPVSWRRGDQDVVGGDAYHYAFGAGGSFAISGVLDLVGETTLIGEKTFSLGVNVSFWD